MNYLYVLISNTIVNKMAGLSSILFCKTTSFKLLTKIRIVNAYMSAFVQK